MGDSFYSLSYFAPVSYMASLLKEEKCWFDLSENFQKQSYHNRCEILGANGRLKLIVPIQHQKKRKLSEIEISYAEDWRKIHFLSLQAAYRRSPYFEFYEHLFESYFKKKNRLLKDTLIDSIRLIFKILKIETSINLIEEYAVTENKNDKRKEFHPKNLVKPNTSSYSQVFQEKFGFTSDLSVLDLIFNLGPEAKTYLEQQK